MDTLPGICVRLQSKAWPKDQVIVLIIESTIVDTSTRVSEGISWSLA